MIMSTNTEVKTAGSSANKTKTMALIGVMAAVTCILVTFISGNSGKPGSYIFDQSGSLFCNIRTGYEERNDKLLYLFITGTDRTSCICSIYRRCR